MTIGEKIKAYRELRGWNQKTLADYSNIPVDNIRKYESGARNPKLAQLQKIANGLQISIHALIDINIETIDDIAPYLFAIAEAGNIQFFGTKDTQGNFLIDDLKFSFKSPTLKHFMKEWADKKEVIDKLRLDAQNSPDKQAREYLLRRADEIEKELKLRMIDSQLIVNAEKEIK